MVVQEGYYGNIRAFASLGSAVWSAPSGAIINACGLAAGFLMYGAFAAACLPLTAVFKFKDKAAAEAEEEEKVSSPDLHGI